MRQKEQDQLLFETPGCPSRAPARHANANAPSLLFPTASQSAPLTSKPWHYTRARALFIFGRRDYLSIQNIFRDFCRFTCLAPSKQDFTSQRAVMSFHPALHYGRF